MRKFAIGCDIGGSHITCAAVDLEQEAVVKKSYTYQKVNNKGTSDEIIDTWATALKVPLTTIEQEQLAGIGFAMPGPFEYDKGIARFTHEVAKYERLNGVDVRHQIQKKLNLKHASDVRFINDATAFAVGEAWLGKATGVARSLSITLGTGFGSAFIDNGIPVVERKDVPNLGCLWHLPFKNGIADDYFSTRWFLKRFAEKSGWDMIGVKEIANRVPLDSRAGDVFVEFGSNLGGFLAPWLKRFEVESLIIGGNISATYKYFEDSLKKSLTSQNVVLAIHISELLEDAALIGSARLFNPVFWENTKPLLSKM